MNLYIVLRCTENQFRVRHGSTLHCTCGKPPTTLCWRRSLLRRQAATYCVAFLKELWYWKKWFEMDGGDGDGSENESFKLLSVSVYECAIVLLERTVCFALSLKTPSAVGRCILCFHFFVACVSDQVRCRFFKMFSDPFNEFSSLPQNVGKFCGSE